VLPSVCLRTPLLKSFRTGLGEIFRIDGRELQVYTFDGDPERTPDARSGKSRISPSLVCGQDTETIIVAEFQRDFLTADNRLEEIRVVVLDPGCGLDHWIVML